MQIVDGLPDDILRNVDSLSVDRRGDDTDAFMVTHEIVGHVSPGRVYCIDENAVIAASADALVHTPPVHTTMPGAVRPPHLRLSGDWDSSASVETEQANIFGDIGILTLTTAEIAIPEASATPEMLGFYGASLITAGDPFEFDGGANLPIVRMEIGAGYAEGFLQVASKGGGAYLEHHDRPHLHMPLDENADGYMLLGRRDGDDYLVSAFPIPFGSAIYTPPDVLHADSYLVGNYLVVYSLTENFSNAVLRAPGGGMVSVRFAHAS